MTGAFFHRKKNAVFIIFLFRLVFLRNGVGFLHLQINRTIAGDME